MAGSLNHLVDETGAFTFKTIENMGDAHEACEECFDIIATLLEQRANQRSELMDACNRAKAPMPRAIPVFGKRAKARECQREHAFIQSSATDHVCFECGRNKSSGVHLRDMAGHIIDGSRESVRIPLAQHEDCERRLAAAEHENDRRTKEFAETIDRMNRAYSELQAAWREMMRSPVDDHEEPSVADMRDKLAPVILPAGGTESLRVNLQRKINTKREEILAQAPADSAFHTNWGTEPPRCGICGQPPDAHITRQQAVNSNAVVGWHEFSGSQNLTLTRAIRDQYIARLKHVFENLHSMVMVMPAMLDSRGVEYVRKRTVLKWLMEAADEEEADLQKDPAVQ